MNPVVHFEMPYRDARRAGAFYEQAFGWKPRFLGEEMGNYIHMTTSEGDACNTDHRGTINGGMFPFKVDWPMQYPSIVIAVEDIRAAMDRVKQAGGEVLGEPMTIPGIGEYVSFTDTEGNRNSILQPGNGC
ncbi:MAG: VOC family protein [Rhodospirillales bacterium]|nr:VOC family protein [Alphaproteobacteria bacterium]MCB9986722.1 VOC family protein [Rhodospirillales bacterium]USO08508.1 MAG: VOC family protein [Rhodospirillales bacterium]